ncbi:MAG TPA: GNAT family N-acetyltransferase, partial [Haliscomenobacter sp.]|nr:GNAT family N-acetyltransferase [Haliscomenobacter sp.]
MITFRSASPQDEVAIAQLHAESWQKHYRGIFSDEYLDQLVVKERAEVWAERFAHPLETRHLILAENEGQLCGFACIELNEDPVFGTLLDNLHVSSDLQGQGIGAQLIHRAAQLAEVQHPGCGFYLFVLEENHPARKFYEHLGAKNHETFRDKNHGGGNANICR